MPSVLRALLILSLAALPVSAANVELAALSTPEGLSLAHGSKTGDILRLSGLELDMRVASGAESTATLPVDLELKRVQIFTPGAKLLLNNEEGVNIELEAPDIAWYSGHIAGSPGSRASLGVRASGEVRGMISHAGGHWLMGRAKGASLDAAITVRRVDQMSEVQTPDHFGCQTSDITMPDGLLPTSPLQSNLIQSIEEKVIADRQLNVGNGANPTYTARIAVESDIQFLDKFPDDDTAAALAYLGDIFAYVSGIFVDEIDTSLEITHSQFWASSDPWTQANPGCALLEFGRYWNDNNTAIDRTIAHFFSGRNNGGGIAWVGVLCNGAFNFDSTQLGCTFSPSTDNFGGDYGYTGDMDANFDIDNPTFVWDVYGWNHEVGHNFDSPHTHCYENVGGSAQPVDTCHNGECVLGCYCGAESLPCPTSGAGCGTIMSYCHLQSGGLSNISPTFGQGHAWGVMPDRVPTRMSAHVVSRANSNAGCLDFFESSLIFDANFEGGNTGEWDSTIP